MTRLYAVFSVLLMIAPKLSIVVWCKMSQNGAEFNGTLPTNREAAQID
jgi:hypothetical protein